MASRLSLVQQRTREETPHLSVVFNRFSVTVTFLIQATEATYGSREELS